MATVPGAWIVDAMPFRESQSQQHLSPTRPLPNASSPVKYLPSFIPGMGFKRTARVINAQAERVVNDPIRFVRHQMAKGDYYPSYVSDIYERLGDNLTPDEEETINWSAMVMYSAGADTTASVLHLFFLNMLLHPEIQQRAREEIDRVVGSDRLPTLDDRDSMPYVEGVVKEAFRWHPVIPMNIAHVVTEDDVFDKYLIPKGAMILPNVW
jgi:cytochrome P450